MYELSAMAFNLADRFRVPVFLMADEIIGHLRERIEIPDSVQRVERRPLKQGDLPFHPGEDLVPGFPRFGSGYKVHVTGLTHDERGYPCTTNPKVHEELVKRLVEKVESKRHEIADYRVTNPDAERVFVTYGSPSRSVEQVIHDNPGEEIGHLRFRVVWPFPEDALREFKDAKAFFVPEQNLGQIAREIERHTSVPVIRIPRFGGSLHTPEELTSALGAFK